MSMPFAGKAGRRSVGGGGGDAMMMGAGQRATYTASPRTTERTTTRRPQSRPSMVQGRGSLINAFNTTPRSGRPSSDSSHVLRSFSESAAIDGLDRDRDRADGRGGISMLNGAGHADFADVHFTINEDEDSARDPRDAEYAMISSLLESDEAPRSAVHIGHCLGLPDAVELPLNIGSGAPWAADSDAERTPHASPRGSPRTPRRQRSTSFNDAPSSPWSSRRKATLQHQPQHRASLGNYSWSQSSSHSSYANVSPASSSVYSRTPASSSFGGSDDSDDESALAEGKQQRKIREDIDHKKDKKRICHSKLAEIQRHGDGNYGTGYKSWAPQQQKRYNAKVQKYEAKEKKYRDQIAKLEQTLAEVNKKAAKKAQEAKIRKDEKRRRGNHFHNSSDVDPASPKLGRPQHGSQPTATASDQSTADGGGAGGGGGGGGSLEQAHEVTRSTHGNRLSFSLSSNSAGSSSFSATGPTSAPPYDAGGANFSFNNVRQTSEPAANPSSAGGAASSVANTSAGNLSGVGSAADTGMHFGRLTTSSTPIPEEGEEDVDSFSADGSGGGGGGGTGGTDDSSKVKAARYSDHGLPRSASPTEGSKEGGAGWGHKFEQWGSNMTRGIKQRLHINTGKHGGAAEAEAKLMEEQTALVQQEILERKRISVEYKSTIGALNGVVRDLARDLELTAQSNEEVFRVQKEMKHELAAERQQLASINQALQEHNSSIKDAVNKKVAELQESIDRAKTVLKAEGSKISRLQDGLTEVDSAYKQQSKDFVGYDRIVNSIWEELEQHKHLHTRRATDWFAEYLHTCPGWQLFLMVVTLMFILSRMSLLTLTTLAAGLAVYRVFSFKTGSGSDGNERGAHASGKGDLPSASAAQSDSPVLNAK